MPMDTNHTENQEDEAAQVSHTWKPLRILSYYRLTLSILLITLLITRTLEDFLGQHDTVIIGAVTLIYLPFATLCVILAAVRRPSFRVQVPMQVTIDILLFTAMIHAGGGVDSGFSLMLFIIIASGSLLTGGRMAYLFASIATLAVLGDQYYLLTQGISTLSSFTKAGLLGLGFFATATLANTLAKRARVSEDLAHRRKIALADMAALNEGIVKLLDTGIVVVNTGGGIRLINEAARRLLGITDTPNVTTLRLASPELDERLTSWHREPDLDPRSFQPPASGVEIIPRFAPLTDDPGSDILIFLDDTDIIAARAQEMRLASLGRLTAGIAHELRNPLGAISHAGQLLDESPDLHKADRRLVEIIKDNSARMNNIIENVLDVSRRSKANAEYIAILPWLREFSEECALGAQVDANAIRLRVEPEDLLVYMDRTHLHQVVWNLCGNALRHGTAEGGEPRVDLVAGIHQESGRPYLEVIDFGPGIEPEKREHIFEPFYSGRKDGNGLGLYIARELCEANRARLEYHAGDGGGSRFRITFAAVAGPRDVPVEQLDIP